MALRGSQIVVWSDNVAGVVGAIKDCCQGHSKYCAQAQQLNPFVDGVRDFLFLVKDSRRFYLCPPRGGQICMWEVVKGGVGFADPVMVACMSGVLRAKAMWLQINEDCNIWSYQIF
jgi:hypothetical protein